MNVKKLCQEYLELKNKNLLLIGDNGSAKTYILEKILEDNKSKKKMYYIAEINKRMNFKDVNKNINKFIDRNEILDRRLEDNKTDINIAKISGSQYFASIYDECYSFQNEEVDMFLSDYVEGYFKSEIVIPEFDEFSDDSMYEFISFENGDVKLHKVLSTGHQGIFRIISEVVYALMFSAEYIFIDELCKNLDTTNSYELMRYLEIGMQEVAKKKGHRELLERMKKVKYVITTHSSDVIQGAENFEIVQIGNQGKEPEEKELEMYYAGNYKDDISIKRKFFPNDAIPVSKKIDEEWLNDLYDRVVIEGKEVANKEINQLKECMNRITEDSEEYDMIKEILEEVGE